jgi:hypothetical protein
MRVGSPDGHSSNDWHRSRPNTDFGILLPDHDTQPVRTAHGPLRSPCPITLNTFADRSQPCWAGWVEGRLARAGGPVLSGGASRRLTAPRTSISPCLKAAPFNAPSFGGGFRTPAEMTSQLR